VHHCTLGSWQGIWRRKRGKKEKKLNFKFQVARKSSMKSFTVDGAKMGECSKAAARSSWKSVKIYRKHASFRICESICGTIRHKVAIKFWINSRFHLILRQKFEWQSFLFSKINLIFQSSNGSSAFEANFTIFWWVEPKISSKMMRRPLIWSYLNFYTQGYIFTKINIFK